jgi:hypothetical protein
VALGQAVVDDDLVLTGFAFPLERNSQSGLRRVPSSTNTVSSFDVSRRP